jgi:hypothetical protein
LLVVARLLLEPRLLDPAGRPDLLLPLFPALAAPLVLFTACSRQTRFPAVACRTAAGIIVLACSIAGPTARFWERNPLFIPPSEMRAAVDWIAARHRAAGGGPAVDVGYDLREGREWVGIACGPRTSWYTVSRPFDWLFLRRHGLAALREGSCSRTDGGDFRLLFRRSARSPSGETAQLALRQLEVRTAGNRRAVPGYGLEP